MTSDLTYEEKMLAAQTLSGAERRDTVKAIKLEYSSAQDPVRQAIIAEALANGASGQTSEPTT